ncbi:MAG: hypothetical protein CMJ23_02030 [Phycisphaerae bacterium]|nr:hypothetical protein [Phycisphaerae bacterium]
MTTKSSVREQDLVRRLQSLEVRLDRERGRRRRFERTALALGAVVMVLGVMAAGRGSSVLDVVQTRRLEILDQSDRVVMLASAARHGGRLDVWDAEQRNIVRLSGNGVGGDLAMFDRGGRQIVGMYADGRAARLEINNPETKTPAVLLTAGRTGGMVSVADEAGQPTIRMTTERRRGMLAIGKPGQDSIVLDSTEAGGRLRVNPSRGRQSVRIEGATIQVDAGTRSLVTIAAEENGGVLQINDLDGKLRLEATASPAGGLLDFRNAEEKAIVSLGGNDTARGLRVRNDSGVSVAAVGSGDDGSGVLEIADLNGARCGVLGVDQTGGRLLLAGRDGRSYVDAGGDNAGGRVEVRDGEERVAAVMRGAKNGGQIVVGLEPGLTGITLDAAGTATPTISIFGPGGRLAALAATPTGGLLNLMDADGGIAVATGSSTRGRGGVLSVRNEVGQEVIHAGVTEDDEGLIEVFNATHTRNRTLSAP